MKRFLLGLFAASLFAVACSSSVAPDPGDGQTGADSDEIKKGKKKGVACGPNTCAVGEDCCNASCGICTKPGDACIQIACGDPPPPSPSPSPAPPPAPPKACGAVTCAADQECCNASCGICVPPGGACIQIECASAK